MVDASSIRVIRVLAIVEGTAVSGPAKNLFEFCRVSRSLDARPVIATSIAIFVRTDKGAGGAGSGSNQLIEAANAAGLEVHLIPERFPFDPQVVQGLSNLVKRLDPDIIQTHHVKSHFLVRLSGLGRLYRWIAFHHGYTNESLKMRLYDRLDKWSLRGPSQIVTVCEPFKRRLISYGVPPSGIVVLHNSISAGWLKQRRVNTAAPAAAQNVGNNRLRNERVVLAVGRLSAEKAFADLIMAMDLLRRLRRDLSIQLLILGDGPERRRIEQLVRDLDLRDRVTLLGHIHDVRPYYQRADVLAISSVTEGSPNVLLEAMAGGVPVVATPVGGIPELVTDKETGLLVEPRNPQAMASAINLLLTDSDLAKTLACNALEVIRKRHSPRDRARFLVELYNRISCSDLKASSVSA
jgi:glycosyltransferase involved in cell wall biosynthesis